MNAQSIKGEREASEKANREPIKLAEPSTKGLSVESARLQRENEELRKKTCRTWIWKEKFVH